MCLGLRLIADRSLLSLYPCPIGPGIINTAHRRIWTDHMLRNHDYPLIASTLTVNRICQSIAVAPLSRQLMTLAFRCAPSASFIAWIDYNTACKNNDQRHAKESFFHTASTCLGCFVATVTLATFR